MNPNDLHEQFKQWSILDSAGFIKPMNPDTTQQLIRQDFQDFGLILVANNGRQAPKKGLW